MKCAPNHLRKSNIWVLSLQSFLFCMPNSRVWTQRGGLVCWWEIQTGLSSSSSSINTLLTHLCKKKNNEKLAGCLVLREVGGEDLGMYNMLAATGYIWRSCDGCFYSHDRKVVWMPWVTNLLTHFVMLTEHKHQNSRHVFSWGSEAHKRTNKYQ